MDVGTLRRRIFDLGILSAFAVIVFMASAMLGSRTAISGEEPETQVPTTVASTTDCAAELAAYALAVVNLEIAQDAAEQAYVDWYRCEFGHDPEPIPGEGTHAKYKLPMFSILER